MTRRKTNYSIIFMLVLFIFFTAAKTPAVAQRQTPVRVLLAANLTQVDFQVEQGSYRLVDAGGQEVAAVPSGSKLTIKMDGGSLVMLQGGTVIARAQGSYVRIVEVNNGELNLFRFQGQRYRGDLNVHSGAGGLVAINVLELEEYLYGVVAEEMPVGAGPEALKAQAVASRSYAVSLLNPGQYYDLTGDTMSQVYRGYEAEMISGADGARRAVDATRSLVIYYDGNVIPAYFHANSGGHTEDSENVWSTPLPYLRGVPSPEDSWALEYPRQSSAGWPAYCYSWTVVMTIGELTEKVNRWLTGQGRAPMGEVKDLVASRVGQDGQKETVSGRVTSLQVISTGGTITLIKNNIRTVLGLRSNLFVIENSASVSILDGSGRQTTVNRKDKLTALGAGGVTGVPGGGGSSFSIAGYDTDRIVDLKSDQIVFKGYGYGHGVGMSQWGAMGMAEKGYTYEEIIEHYYNQGRGDGRLKIAPYI